jgi:ATP-dependent DNA helicase RecQ
MRLTGRDAGAIFDRLHAEQVRLARGEHGTEKPLSCTSTTLRKLAETRPSTLSALDGIGGLGPQKIDRFGAAFLAVLREDSD